MIAPFHMAMVLGVNSVPAIEKCGKSKSPGIVVSNAELINAAHWLKH